jgi:hypothetical protein
MKKIVLTLLLTTVLFSTTYAAYLLIPMDEKQKQHLKAYGITYWVIDKGVEAHWLLNYRGGSFAFKDIPLFEKECLTRGVTFEVITDGQFANIQSEIGNQEANMDDVKLEKAPKIAVYSPLVNERGEEVQPWDDAVTLVLSYAEIPYEVIYDEEILSDKLPKYDWVHLHHEDFTGQYGRFYASFNGAPWYKENQKRQESLAQRLGFNKVSQLKLAVVKQLKEWVGGGGFMFAMCSATDSYDIALSADGLDICEKMFDGDPDDPTATSKLDYTKTFAFQNYQLITNPMIYEFSQIDNDPGQGRSISPQSDYFTLFDFSAKWDPIPTMLTQCHTRSIKGFMGQTTAFKKEYLKQDVLVLGETKSLNEARYIHGSYGQGTWSFYGGHDPEDYRHYVNDPNTDLSLHPNSPGYRLILNNILFPAAKKKKRKT